MKVKRIGPSRWWHLVAGVIFLGGAFGAPVGLALSLMHLISDGEQFLAPGKHTIAVTKPRRCVIWHNPEAFYKGTQYSSPASLPAGTTIKVIQERTGMEIDTKATTSGSETSGNSTRYSVCSFEAPEAGDYTISVQNLEDNRVFMVRDSRGLFFVALFLVIGPLCFAGWVVPPIIVLVVELKRYRNRKSVSDRALQETSASTLGVSLETPEA